MFEIPEHTCEVVQIKLCPHPNADTLSLVMVGEFQCAVRTSDWSDGDLAVYIPPDSVVPESEQFEFLGTHRRIKARKLRGEWSVGLLIHAPDDVNIGDDCMDRLGIVHYEPPMRCDFSTGGENETPPVGFFPVYDVLNFRKYCNYFQEGEQIVATEKLHGANARFACINDAMFCGSRKFWKKKDPNNLWWKALEQNQGVEQWLRDHPGHTIYGEIFGSVQSLKYGAKNGQIFLAVFDILKGSKWLDFDQARLIGDSLPWVPLVYKGKFDKKKMLELAEDDSSIECADHCREGVVVKPVIERTDRRIGRVQLKIVGNRYLSKS